MENGVQKFDMEDVKKRMVDQIRATFIMMMPDDAFKNLVDAEVRDFITPKEHTAYGRVVYSTLQQLVREEVHATMKALIKAELSKPEWFAYLGQDEHGNPKIGDELKKLLTAMAPKLMEAAFQNIVSNAIDTIRNSR